jgi:hypothetical protein
MLIPTCKTSTDILQEFYLIVLLMPTYIVKVSQLQSRNTEDDVLKSKRVCTICIY